MKVAHLYCYGRIDDEINSFSSEKVLTFLSSLDKSVTDIEVHINSNGGNLFTSYCIHDQLINSGKNIHTIAEGVCASAATVVFLSGSKRSITENGRLMIHSPYIPSEVSLGDMRADDFLNAGIELKADENEMAAFYVKKTGMDLTDVKSLMSKDSFIPASEAIELKLATDLAKPVKAYAYYKNTNKIDLMNFKDKMKASLNKVLEMFEEPIAPVATSAKTTDGEIYFDGTLDVGTKVFTDAAMTTPCSDGMISMEDGSTVTVMSGAVTEMQAAASIDDVTSLKAENKTLKAKILELSNQKTETETIAEKTVSELTARLEKIV